MFGALAGCRQIERQYDDARASANATASSLQSAKKDEDKTRLAAELEGKQQALQEAEATAIGKWRHANLTGLVNLEHQLKKYWAGYALNSSIEHCVLVLPQTAS